MMTAAKKRIKQWIVALLLGITITSFCAGEVIYQTDFSGGWPAGWTVDGLKGANEPAWPTWWWNIEDSNNNTGGDGNFVRATYSGAWQSPYPYSVMYTHALDLGEYESIRIAYDSRVGMDLGGMDDYQTLDVSLNGVEGPWMNIWSNFAHDAVGANYEFLVPQADNQDHVMFRFQWCDGPLMGHGGVGGAEWCIDNLVISGTVGQAAPPDAPTGVSASDGTFSTKVVISWDAVQDADTYRVYRATSADGVKTAISDWQAATTFDDDTVTLFRTYYYWVAAKNTDGTSAYSDVDTGYSFFIFVVPSVPTNVVASDGTYRNKIRISWDPVAYALNYEVFLLRVDDLFLISPISGVQAETWFDYTNVVAGKTYTFAVRASNAIGASDLSAADTGSVGEPRVRNDYNGNHKSDMACYDASSGNWFFMNDQEEQETLNWGWESAISVPADYDGDQQTDIAVYWPEEGNWYINGSSDDFETINWGWAQSIPVSGDYDGDGMADLAVYWPETGNWYINQSQDGYITINWGWDASIPVPADYDGDGKTDIAVFYPADGNWYINGSTEHFETINWGWSEAIPIPADYDGDTRADVVVYSPERGQWFMNLSANGFFIINFGAEDGWPVAGDYDGDDQSDLSLYYPETHQWQIKYAAGGDDAEYTWEASSGLPADIMTSIYILHTQ